MIEFLFCPQHGILVPLLTVWHDVWRYGVSLAHRLGWPRPSCKQWWNVAALVWTFGIGMYMPFLFIHHRYADIVWLLLLLVFVWR